MTRAWTWVALALCACGTSKKNGAPEAFTSGSRLRAMYQDGGEGARNLSGWHDTELDIDCSFRQDEDLTYRCMPSQPAGRIFRDAACTDPVMFWDTECSPLPALVQVGVGAACSTYGSVVAYETGEAVQITRYYEDYGDGNCVENTFDPPQTLYEMSPVDSDQFAEATTRHVDVAGGLGVEMLETSDGASMIHGLTETEGDRLCRAFDLAGGDEYCVPGEVAYAFEDNHTDAECTLGDVASSYSVGGCAPPEVVLRYDRQVDGECTSYVGALAARGEELSQEDVYTGSEEGCAPAQGDSYRYYAIGEPIGTAFPRLTHVGRGTGRLRFDSYATADGKLLAPGYGTWTDTSVERNCFPQATPDGTRCLPDYTEVRPDSTAYWADDACETERLANGYGGSCGSEPYVPAILLLRDLGEGCDAPPTAAYEVQDPYEGTVYVSYGPDLCEPYTPSEGESFFSVASTPTPFSDFGEVTTVTE